jgi:Domain of unknown function (DUF4336)
MRCIGSSPEKWSFALFPVEQPTDYAADMSSAHSTDPNTRQNIAAPLEPVAPNIWVAEGSPVSFLGMLLGTRMTVIRLRDGSLWIHSPVGLTPELARAIDPLGRVGALVAPNKYHHLFLRDWIAAYPTAGIYAAPGLPQKRRDIVFSDHLTDLAPSKWAEEIDQVVFRGSRSFDEMVFFHRQSRTAILTDLIVNVRLDTQPMLGRLVGKLDGVAFPHGTTPRLFQLSMKSRSDGRRAVEKIVGWQPEMAIISHGEWFRANAERELRKRLSWLL